MITLDRVYKASRVLKEIIRETDMIYAPNIRKGTNVYLKTENLQVTGSFKIRGSYFKISQLTDEEKAHGVIAASAGNHAQGVALAATKSGIKSLICLPAARQSLRWRPQSASMRRFAWLRACLTTLIIKRLSFATKRLLLYSPV